MADVAICFINSPNTGVGYDANDLQSVGNGYFPISLQYGPYTAVYARETSIAGGDPLENFMNRSYKGKTVVASNIDDLFMVLDTYRAMKGKPVIVVLNMSKPTIVSEFEGYIDGLLVTFDVQSQAIFDIITGKFEPQGLLPMQMPTNMKTVELQNEDVPHDMECYVDSEGNVYDFGFGLNWSGRIIDDRVIKYVINK
jgi:beta-glucosidase